MITFFFNDTATTEIYTLSLHDALPISAAVPASRRSSQFLVPQNAAGQTRHAPPHSTGSAPRLSCGILRDRKSTRLNSSHQIISYAVFCLKKKKLKEKPY